MNTDERRPAPANMTPAAHGDQPLEWVFVSDETTPAILRAKVGQEIAGLPCQLNNSGPRESVIIKSEHGTLGYAPADVAGEITARMRAAGPGRLVGEILNIRDDKMIVQLRYTGRGRLDELL